MVKRDPSWVIWSTWPMGFTYGAGFISDQMPPGFPLLVHELLGSAGAYLRVPAERGIHRAGRYFRSCVFVGVGVGRVLLSRGVPPSSVLPRAKPGLGGQGVVAAVALVPSRVGPPQGRVESLIRRSPGRGVRWGPGPMPVLLPGPTSSPIASARRRCRWLRCRRSRWSRAA